MADKVALIEDEYTTLQSQLESGHTQILDYIESLVGQLENISAQGGAFYTESISPNVALLCEEIRSVKTTLGEVYMAHREIVKSFVTAIEDLDTCC